MSGPQGVSVQKQITIEKMRRYSAETNSIHTSEEAGQKAGLGGAIAQGGQLVGYLIEYMIKSQGEKFLVGGEISVTFVKPVRSGDVVQVRSESQAAPSPECDLELQIWLENQRGDKVTVGTASVGRRK